MSERGSWTSEYIYCGDCLEALESLLENSFGANGKFFTMTRTPPWAGARQELNILHGKIGGLGPGGEIRDMREALQDERARALCHRVRVVVLGESGFTAIFWCGLSKDLREELVQ